MTGAGTAAGAGTIVNAMATGRGVAFGLAYRVTAHVRPASTWSVASNGALLSAPANRLALTTARLVQGRAGRSEAWRIDVASDIPPERGLKSSSAVAVAVLHAALNELDLVWKPEDILVAAAEASLEAGVSVTGAFDDAAACLLGGICLTDNRRKQLIERRRLPIGLEALVLVPETRLPTSKVRHVDFSPIEGAVAQAWRLAQADEVRAAMLLNTAAYAPLFGHDTRFTLAAIRHGAWAAGLSGKGPAEVALGDDATLRRLHEDFPNARRVALNHGGDS